MASLALTLHVTMSVLTKEYSAFVFILTGLPRTPSDFSLVSGLKRDMSISVCKNLVSHSETVHPAVCMFFSRCSSAGDWCHEQAHLTELNRQTPWLLSTSTIDCRAETHPRIWQSLLLCLHGLWDGRFLRGCVDDPWTVEKSSLCTVTSCVAYTSQLRLVTIYVGPTMTFGEGLGPPIFADRSQLELDVVREWLSVTFQLGVSFS